MRISKVCNRLSLVLTCFICAISAQSEPLFTFGNDPLNEVLWRGKTLIESDSLSFFADNKLSQKMDAHDIKEVHNWKVVNGWSTNSALPFRREVGILQDGSEIELNFQANQPAYHQKENVDSLQYTFCVALTNLAGMRYTALIGRASKLQSVQGLLKERPTSGTILNGTRYVAFEGNGRKLVFEMGPQGVCAGGDFGPNSIQQMWRVTQTPTHLLFSFKANNTDYGGMVSGKVRIYEAPVAADYMSRHAHQQYTYYDALPAERLFCFGATKHGKNYTNANLKKYSPQQSFGWLDPTDLRIETARESGAVYAAATGNGPKTFRCDLKRPGLYILTLRCPGYAQKRGAFSITSNEQKLITKIEIAPYTLKNITWSQWLENGALTITLDGANWSLATLGLQLLQHSCEDFTFRRGFWLAPNVYEPHPLNSGQCFAQPPQHAISISEIELPREVIIDPLTPPTIPQGEVCLPNANAPQMAWRYNTVIGTLGPGNNGAFTEFATQPLIERRLQETQDNGINTVLLNGLLSRHTFKSQLSRVEENIAALVKTAHQKNMRIIDHQDLTLLWNLGEGFRVMCERIGETQVSINANLPLRGFCINNKVFNDTYFKWLVAFVKKTDLDGIMIDEATFFSVGFCGCPDCRRKFTAETGLVLPLDETSPLLFNKESALWKAWLQWRIKTVGDWNLRLRQHIMPFKPYFTVMKYTTHYGYTSPWAPIAHGADLAEIARSCDFLGTEIMSRNVVAANRAVFALRKAKNALRTAFNTPIFGLVYPMQSNDIAYFGWALNNMNAQVTWMISGRRDNDNLYTAFKNNFDPQHARSVADIGMLYSLQSRNWGKNMPVVNDTIGASQALTDRHIMHDFFLEKSMSAEFLSKYRAVMLNSTCSLSDAQIAVLLDYVHQGGTLFLSAKTATCDQLGTSRQTWPFAHLLGVSPVNNRKLEVTPPHAIRFVAQPPIKYNHEIVKVVVDSNNPPTVLAEAIDQQGQTLQPLIVVRNYAQGRIIYCAAQLGGVNYEHETSPGDKWPFVMDQDVSDFFHQTLQKIVLDNQLLSFTALTLPERVRASVYTQTLNNKTTTTVHLLNATGVNLCLGQNIPAQPMAPVWPELNEDVVFEITLPQLTRAHAASPQWPDFKPVKAESIGNNRFRITIAKELIKSYVIVFLEQ